MYLEQTFLFPLGNGACVQKTIKLTSVSHTMSTHTVVCFLLSPTQCHAASHSLQHQIEIDPPPKISQMPHFCQTDKRVLKTTGKGFYYYYFDYSCQLYSARQVCLRAPES